MDANGVNYYKGVLLCSRPNQSPSVQIDKPFCGRVNVQQQLGLVPTKQYGQHRTRKRQLPVLNNHKKWLQKFKKQLDEKKNKQLQQDKKKQQYLQKLRQQGRQKMKQISSGVQNSTSQGLNNSSPQKPTKQSSGANNNNQKQANPHRKKPKPAWAQTQQQNQNNQQEQVDELLNFFQKGDTQQVKDYLNDEDVKKILVQLKSKIQNLKQQGTQWKDKELIKIQDENQQQERQRSNNKDDKDDILSRISKQSGSQSVTSQKTAQRVQQLKRKKQAKQWDKMTASSKKSTIASVDEQIAKHIADEILRNYPNLKHHSNQSIRKLLQKQARQQLKA